MFSPLISHFVQKLSHISRKHENCIKLPQNEEAAIR